MKKLIVFAGLMILCVTSYADDPPYYSITSVEDYVELTNPISINNGEVWDRETVYTIDLDFDFTIYDHSFSAVTVHAGGNISFPGYGYKRLFIYHTPFGGMYLRDKGTTSSISDLDYEVTGEEGSYIIKIQWDDAGFGQWFSTSDTSDYVDFQVWIFQEDAHLEIRFGPSQTDPGTYGYPEAQSDPDPGPSIAWRYDSCDHILAYYDDADDPEYKWMNTCDPNYSFVDGTPSDGIVYSIIPAFYVGEPENKLDKLVLYPNPATEQLFVANIPPDAGIRSVTVFDAYGNNKLRFANPMVPGSKMSLNVEGWPAGVYFLNLMVGNELISRRFVKVN